MRIPRHIAIIPDGNRRWAQSNGMEKQEGYRFGLNPGLEALRIAKDYGVEEITFYGFTTDNCKRPAAQVRTFTQACVNAVERIAEEDAALLVVGNTDSAMFPRELLAYTDHRVIYGNGSMKVNFLVNYGWEWDMSEMNPHATSRKSVTNGLHSHDISRIDLVIRWGGRRRLSGLLPVQTVYADFYVIDTMWPDFSGSDMEKAFQWYDKQDVTLGG
ncbi:MAG: polyprenyl diphosphate synthase [Clostridia bacterium]